MKIGCVIQGDIRRGTNWVLRDLPRKFDFTVLSTWAEDRHAAPHGDYLLVTNAKPSAPGLSHRNYQRFSTARGIQAAKEAGCDYVLKWRTDMVPVNLNLNLLISWATYEVPHGVKSRIVMPAFRNLSVEQDWFSSIPDLFSFGHVDEMELLWGDSGFDYSLNMNFPDEMLVDIEKFNLGDSRLSELYCAESELYAIFKSRLQSKLAIKLNHPRLALDYFRLFDHRKLGVFWFAKNGGFRSIGQAWEHPWWTESTWERQTPKIVPWGYPVSGLLANLRRAISPFRVKLDQHRQSILWNLRA